MKELLQNLTNANNICRAANVHYEKAGELEGQIAEKEAAMKKSKTKWLIIGFAIYLAGGMVSSFFMAISMALGAIANLGLLAAAVYFAINGSKKESAGAVKEIEALRAQINAENAAGQQVFDDNAQALAFLPVDYWYPLATGYLLQLIQSERAANLAEALDKFEEQLHRWKLEEANAQMVATQEQQTAYLASIKTSSRISAIANVTNTAFNIARRL